MPVPSHRNLNTIVVGGGVVGLSIAWELAKRDLQVTVLERANLGKAASWAGAGILPPPPGPGADHPLDELARRSSALHPVWANQLQDCTGINTGYQNCGGLYLAHRPGEVASLSANVASWRDEGLELEEWSVDHLIQREPHLRHAADRGKTKRTFWVSGESQLRNPRHLKALQRACEVSGVRLCPQTPVQSIQRHGKEWRIDTPDGTCIAEQVCIASGAWTALVTESIGVMPDIVPIRGQMRLYQTDTRLLNSILNEGPRYLVPRSDGLLLAGSTEEDAGFDASTTPAGLESLQSFAESWLPQLTPKRCIRSWAGLRPGSVDGFPYLGSVPEHPGLFVAAGHFRNGLYLSPATAEFMADLMTGQKPGFDIAPFSIGRGLHLTAPSSPQFIRTPV
jgi:glycine oxidase